MGGCVKTLLRSVETSPLFKWQSFFVDRFVVRRDELGMIDFPAALQLISYDFTKMRIANF
jgi:hypothetical protein